MKTYGELCPLSRALDLVGDRWAMLVIRELIFGPRRYSDLADGLPGIGSNVLAARLADLQQAGVISKSALPKPTPVTVYQLTDAGRALLPAIGALASWGAAHGRRPAEGDALQPAWLLLLMIGRPTALRPGEACQMHIDGEVFTLQAGPSGLRIQTGTPREADAAIILRLDALGALLRAPEPPPVPEPGIEVHGDHAVASRAIKTLAGGLSGHTARP